MPQPTNISEARLHTSHLVWMGPGLRGAASNIRVEEERDCSDSVRADCLWSQFWCGDSAAHMRCRVEEPAGATVQHSTKSVQSPNRT